MKSTGAAIGTLIAESAVLLVQYHALRGEVGGTVREIHWFNITAGVLLGIAASVWVKALALGNLLTLVIAAVLFFGIYGGFLMVRKETMVMEMYGQAMKKIRRPG